VNETGEGNGMKKLQWNMEEVFYFPENVGVPKDARLVKVKAGFTEKRSEDAVRLSGIYHIAAKVDFTEGERSETLPADAVFVDDVELEGETGYFEYAVPLYIDLPPEVEHPLHIEATDVNSTFDGQGSFKVAWNVNCTYGEDSTGETASDERTANRSDEGTANRSDERTANRSDERTANRSDERTANRSDERTSNKSDETVKNETSNNQTSTEVNIEAEIVEEKKEAVAVQDAPKEKVAERVQEPEQVVQVTEPRPVSAVQNKTAAEPVQERQASAMHDSSSLDGRDDILSYIAALPDEWTTTRFRSNDIFVKEES
jgi:hypothetical protein